MASKKISELDTKTTFGETDFLAGTQGTDTGDNRKYGKAAIQEAVQDGFLSLEGNSFAEPISGPVFVSDPGPFRIVDAQENDIVEVKGVGGGSVRSGRIAMQRAESGVLTDKKSVLSATFLEITDNPNGTDWYNVFLSDQGLRVSTGVSFPPNSGVILLSFAEVTGKTDGTKTLTLPYENGTLLTDAPQDGNAYVRKDGAWVDITTL